MSVEISLIAPLLAEFSVNDIFKNSQYASSFRRNKLNIKWNVLMQNTLVEFIKINVNCKSPLKDKVIYFRRCVNNLIFHLSSIRDQLKTDNVELIIDKHNRVTIYQSDIALISWLVNIIFSLRRNYQF